MLRNPRLPITHYGTHSQSCSAPSYQIESIISVSIPCSRFHPCSWWCVLYQQGEQYYISYIANKLFLAFLFADKEVRIQLLKDVGLLRTTIVSSVCGCQISWCDASVRDAFRWWCRTITIYCCVTWPFRHIRFVCLCVRPPLCPRVHRSSRVCCVSVVFLWNGSKYTTGGCHLSGAFVGDALRASNNVRACDVGVPNKLFFAFLFSDFDDDTYHLTGPSSVGRLCWNHVNTSSEILANSTSLSELTLPAFADIGTQIVVTVLRDFDQYYELKSVPEGLKLPLASRALADPYAKSWMQAVYHDLHSYDEFKQKLTQLLWNEVRQSSVRVSIFQDRYDRRSEKTMQSHFPKYAGLAANLQPPLSEQDLIYHYVPDIENDDERQFEKNTGHSSFSGKKCSL